MTETITIGDALFAFVVFFFIAAVIVFGLKTAQLNKLPGGDPYHLLAGRILWVVGTIAAVVTVTIWLFVV